MLLHEIIFVFQHNTSLPINNMCVARTRNYGKAAVNLQQKHVTTFAHITQKLQSDYVLYITEYIHVGTARSVQVSADMLLHWLHAQPIYESAMIYMRKNCIYP